MVSRVCFISILRLLQLLRAQTDPDFTYVAAELSYLTAVEVNGAIVCACVMTLKPFLARFFPRIWGSSARSRSSRSGGSGTRRRMGFGRRGRGKRGSETLVNYSSSGPGGPPTIGSLPSKLKGPLAGLERDVWIEGDVRGKSGRRVWVDGGYVEIDDGDGDVWGVDVELAEHVNGRNGDGERVVVPPPVVRNGIVRVDTEVTVQVSSLKAGN
jgi:hypothetical protein